MKQELTPAQRQQRANIRNLFLCATIEEMEQAKTQYDAFARSVLQEMIDTCRQQEVDNFGETTY